jgi:hypothetical protein
VGHGLMTHDRSRRPLISEAPVQREAPVMRNSRILDCLVRSSPVWQKRVPHVRNSPISVSDGDPRHACQSGRFSAPEGQVSATKSGEPVQFTGTQSRAWGLISKEPRLAEGDPTQAGHDIFRKPA